MTTTDRSIASEEQIEHAITKHRNLKFDDKFEPRGMINDLKPGEGVFVPYLWPHWVRTKDTYSISLAITWKTPAVKRRNDIYQANSMLRDRGFPQKAPGVQPGMDAIKLGAFRTLQFLRRPAAQVRRRSQDRSPDRPGQGCQLLLPRQGQAQQIGMLATPARTLRRPGQPGRYFCCPMIGRQHRRSLRHGGEPIWRHATGTASA